MLLSESSVRGFHSVDAMEDRIAALGEEQLGQKQVPRLEDAWR
jgi:hypothetical protein